MGDLRDGWAEFVKREWAGMFAGVLVAMKWKPRRTILAGILATATTMPTPFILLGSGAVASQCIRRTGVQCDGTGWSVARGSRHRDAGRAGAMMASGVMLLVVTLFSLFSRDVRTVRVDPEKEPSTAAAQ